MSVKHLGLPIIRLFLEQFVQVTPVIGKFFSPMAGNMESFSALQCSNEWALIFLKEELQRPETYQSRAMGENENYFTTILRPRFRHIGELLIFHSFFHLFICWCPTSTATRMNLQQLGQICIKERTNLCIMMTSSNGNIISVTGPLCGEFTGHWWIPLTKVSDAELWHFLWSVPG